jgi:hypothetical protein
MLSCTSTRKRKFPYHFSQQLKPPQPTAKAVISRSDTVQVCRQLVFLGPGFRPPRFNFVVNSSFWGQAFSRHGSTLSSARLFGARLSAATVQLCHRLVFLGLVPESINSRTTKKKSDLSKKSDFLAQPIRLLPKSVVLTGGMKISALLH